MITGMIKGWSVYLVRKLLSCLNRRALHPVYVCLCVPWAWVQMVVRWQGMAEPSQYLRFHGPKSVVFTGCARACWTVIGAVNVALCFSQPLTGKVKSEILVQKWFEMIDGNEKKEMLHACLLGWLKHIERKERAISWSEIRIVRSNSLLHIACYIMLLSDCQNFLSRNLTWCFMFRAVACLPPGSTFWTMTSFICKFWEEAMRTAQDTFQIKASCIA